MDLFWTGTDALRFYEYPKGISLGFKIKIFVERILIKILDRYFIQRHLVVHSSLEHFIVDKMKSPIHENEQTFHKLEGFGKEEHDFFNILYYRPLFKKNQEYHDWIYGYDVQQEVEKICDIIMPNIQWVVVDGNSDMKGIYPIIDFYFRPNRHDGMPMMIKECNRNNIPYYWTRFLPSVRNAVLDIKQYYEEKNGRKTTL